MFLHEEHELLRRARAVAEQLLRDLAHLAHRARRPTSAAGSFTGPSRSRSATTASRSTSGGNAPRSRNAASCPRWSPVVPSTSSRRNASRCCSSRPARHAEVEQRGAAVGLHDEVAAVQVAVEDAVDQRALERRDEAGLQQRVGVDPGRVHRLDVVEGEAASRSITSTRRVTSVGWGRGTMMPRCSVSASTPRCRACSAPRAGSRAPR